MKYLLFERSAIETMVSKSTLQSVDFEAGSTFVDILYGKEQPIAIETVHITYDKDGIMFVGKSCSSSFLFVDLCQCKLLEAENRNAANVLIVLQKAFRTAIRIWDNQPFTSSERINGSKSIVFPFVFTDHRRIVMDRAPECKRLKSRGVIQPLLAYKYSAEDAPHGGEIINYDLLNSIGEVFIRRLPSVRQYYLDLEMHTEEDVGSNNALQITNTSREVSDGGFMYLSYEQQLERLTLAQKEVVESVNISSPIRIDGPAGTGKTASMILRAYHLLNKAREENRVFHVVFFSHSESARYEAEFVFSQLKGYDTFLSQTKDQWIVFTTLLDYCINATDIRLSQVIEQDATEAKYSQRILIEEALDKVMKRSYRTYKPLLSMALKSALDSSQTSKGALLSMLQHEFSIQIKGRTDSTIEKYYELPAINNALPVCSRKDKEFVFSIFVEYQNMLQKTAVYDVDDITIQAISIWNAPIWRRERREEGFDYIFIDEMHLFNLNEKHTFHYLTKTSSQEVLPICFAIDYNQAIGDRGSTDYDYFEQEYKDIVTSKYQTVFRCSPQITDFCASIAATGALMFENDYKNPYAQSASNFTAEEEARCSQPCLYMYSSDDAMIAAIKKHVENSQRELQCKNHEIAVVTFEPSLLDDDAVSKLSESIGKNITVLQDRYSLSVDRTLRANNGVVLSSPYNINGLEFKAVLLVGVDEGRVPQKVGVSDVSENYIRYIAFNQLYLASSRAKYKLILLGNKLHGDSSCLRYALESETIEKCDIET